MLAARPRAADLAQAPAPAPASAHDVVARYCETCHNDRLRTGGLTLAGLDVDRPDRDAAAWEKVIRKLRARVMPPAGMPRPDEAAYDRLVGGLESALDAAAAR